MMKSQDIVVLAKLISYSKKNLDWTQASLAKELCLSPSQINYGLKRLLASKLIVPVLRDNNSELKLVPVIQFCEEFLIHGFKCFEFALGLYELNEYMDLKIQLVKNGCHIIFANSYFMAWLIKNKYLKNGQSIILYKNDKKISHAGLYENKGKIRSKWGEGNLWEHNELEVPNSYGKKNSTFDIINKENAFLYFKYYVEEYQLTEKILQNYCLSTEEKCKLNNKVNWTMLAIVIRQTLFNKIWFSENWKPVNFPSLGGLLQISTQEEITLSFSKKGCILSQTTYSNETNDEAISEYIKQIYRGNVNNVKINDDR